MSVPTGTQATFAATLVDEWVRAGVTDAVVCPGSRSTPLALALAARGEIALHVRLDERSAGFFALGLARASGRPAIVCVTSGTAAVELHPAVVEAHHGGVPLLVCTADRPPELQDVGAPQTIDQVGLYGRATRWATAPGVADAAGRASWRSVGARAALESRSGPGGPGPVHLNLAFREPLVEAPGELPLGRPGGRPWHAVAEEGPGGGDGGRAVSAGWAGRRGVIVAGGDAGPPDALVGLATVLGWPLLADPRSRARVTRSEVVAAADAFLRDPAVRAALRPEVVVTLGQPWLSKALGAFVLEAAHAGAEVLTVDPWWRWFDADRSLSQIYRADPGIWLAEATVAGQGGEVDPAWLATWQMTELAAQAAVSAVLADDEAARGGRLSEPALARGLLELVGPDTLVVVAASMPVRDLEWFAAPCPSPPRVVANRGVNGIDGVSSTARGAAAAGDAPVVGLLGDLAFLHDVSALVEGVETAAGRCTLVVLDNGGGGIFSFLPQAAALDASSFETLFGTPQRTSVSAVATGFGLPVAEVSTPGELAGALAAFVGHEGLAVVRVIAPDRADNAALHDRLAVAVGEGVGRALGPSLR